MGYLNRLSSPPKFGLVLRLFLKAAVKLIDTSELYLREYLLEKRAVQQLSYAYQYQTQDGTLIFATIMWLIVHR